MLEASQLSFSCYLTDSLAGREHIRTGWLAYHEAAEMHIVWPCRLRTDVV